MVSQRTVSSSLTAWAPAVFKCGIKVSRLTLHVHERQSDLLSVACVTLNNIFAKRQVGRFYNNFSLTALT